MRSVVGVLLLVIMVKIYNFRELRDELIGQGEVFTSRFRHRVLLAAFKHWGQGALTKLNGMFAFALGISRAAVDVSA